MIFIVGLGNPGEEYAQSRHNTGRMLLERFAKKEDIALASKGVHFAHVGKGKLSDEPVTIMLPDTYMNKSGKSVVTLVKSAKQAEKLLVVYDDLDLPFGTVRMAFGRSSGGHNGVESIIKALKTKDFVRIRVGVCPTTPSGKLRKPQGEDAVIKFLMGDFGTNEMAVLKKIEKQVFEGITLFATEGREVATMAVNSK